MKQITEPYFSIILPTYNRSEFIGDTIKSIKTQTFHDFELIIVDDGSTDNTHQIVTPFLNEKIKYFKQQNRERGAARNFGVKKSNGTYITFLDSDDLLYHNHLQVAKDYIEKHPNTSIFHSGYEIKNNLGKVLGTQDCSKIDINRALLAGNPLSCIGVFLKKEIAQEFPFNENRDMAGSEDWELWVRIACHYQIQCTGKITASLIHHEERSVINIKNDKIIERINLAFQEISSYPPFIKKYGQFLTWVQSHLFLYLSLHLALDKSKKTSIYYLWKAIQLSPPNAFSYKTAGILKALIKSLA
ncbi:MAG: glycosyltransferase family A protein [Cyclobacteriaceae bacterium]